MKKAKRISCAAALAVLLVFLWAAPAFAVSYATVFGGWLRLRALPSYDATVMASYPNGTVVTVLGQSVGWARVQTPDARVGYMDVRYLRFGSTPTATPKPTAAPSGRTWTTVNRTAWITSGNGRDVRMRSAPAVENRNVMGLYPVGRTVYQLRVSNDGWSYIKIDGKHGYMMTQFLRTSGPVWPTAVPVITATPYWPPVPTATPSPVPVSPEITNVKISPYQPKVGDTIQVYLTPVEAEYACVWYNEAGILLSTSKTYKVREVDVGHVIHVRIQGTGVYTGFVADGTTAAVKAAP